MMKDSNNKMQIKVIAGFGIAMLILVFAALLNFYSLNKLTEAVKTISSPDKKLIAIKSLRNFLSEEEKNTRAYSLTKDENYLASFQSVKDSIHYCTATLQSLTNDNKIQASIADTISNLAAACEGLLSSYIEKIKSRNEAVNQPMELKPQLNPTNKISPINKTDTIKQSTEKQKGFFNNLFSKKNKSVENNAGIVTNKTNTHLSQDEIDTLISMRQDEITEELKGMSFDELLMMQQDKNLMYLMESAIKNLESNELEAMQIKAVEANSNASLAIKIVSITGILGIFCALLFIYFILIDISRSNKYKLQIIEEKKKTEQLANIKQQFVANMSHEIRTPLNSIIGFTEQVMKESMPLKQKQFIHSIAQASEHLLLIVNQILDFSKIDSGYIHHTSVSFSYSELIADVYDIFKIKSEVKDINLSYQIDKSIPDNLFGDMLSLKQILINIIGNAVKFTDGGSIKINCSLHHAEGDLVYIQSEIMDTGKGIDDDKIEKIFEEFSQEDEDIARKYGGTGLGLAITRKLVNVMKGTIEVKSKKNEGSVFTITVPFRKSKAIADTSKLPREYLKFEGNHVLVVDDENMNLVLAQTILGNWNLKISIATNATDAIKKFNEHPFDLILIDIQMPEISGIELAKMIRELDTQHAKTIPIIALTANTSGEYKGTSFKDLFNKVLIKPYRENELYNVISSILHKTSIDDNVIEKETSTVSYSLGFLEKTSGSNTEFITTMINSFIENTTDNIALLKVGLAEEDWELVHRLAHKMVPAYRYFRISKSEEELKQLMNEAEGGKNYKTIASLIQFISDDTEAIIKSLQQDLKKLKPMTKNIT